MPGSTRSGRQKRRPEWFDAVAQKMRDAARKDPNAFIQNLLWIVTKQAQRQLLKYNWSQQQCAEAIAQQEAERNPVRLYILKSRQVGMSTWSEAQIFARTWSRDNHTGLVLAHRKDRAQRLLEIYKLFYECLPVELQLPLAKNTQDSLFYQNSRSGTHVIAGSSVDATRSLTCQSVHASEIGFWDDLFAQMGALEQTVPYTYGSLIILETTANGAGTPAHLLWEKAKQKKVPYIAKFLEWYNDPDCRLPPFKSDLERHAMKAMILEDFPELLDRQAHYKLTDEMIGWYYYHLKDKCYGDTLLMQQEYPCDDEEAWVSAGSPVFPSHLLLEYRMKTRKGNYYRIMEDGRPSDFKNYNQLSKYIERPHEKVRDEERDAEPYLEVWKPPEPGHFYIIGADCSAGYADSDFGSAFIIDAITFDMCAEVHGRFEPDQFATVLANLGWTYNQALIAPELEGVGLAVLALLQQKYWHIYQTKSVDAYDLKTTGKLGWTTNHTTRPVLIANAKRLFREKAKQKESMGDFIPSKALIDEMRTFTIGNVKNPKPQAAAGCYDDRVMAAAIAWIVAMQERYGFSLEDQGDLPPAMRPKNSMIETAVTMEEALFNALDWNQRRSYFRTE